MNLTLFLIIIIALIIIFSIILYNGLRILLSVEKEKSIVKYEFKITMLKITVLKRNGIKGSDEDLEENEEESEDEAKESEDENDKKDDKGLMEKYEDIKPILIELKKSKDELKGFLKDLLRTIDIKRLEGNLIIGLEDNTTTIKIASWIWSIGAIVNGKKSTLLTVEPRFKESVIDFEGKMELKINLLILLIFTILLLSKKNIRELIKELYRQKKARDKEKSESVNSSVKKSD